MQHPQCWSAIIDSIILSSQLTNPKVEHLPHNIQYAFSYTDCFKSSLIQHQDINDLILKSYF